MKKFTLLIAMLVCMVGFSQETEVKKSDQNNPVRANQAATKHLTVGEEYQKVPSDSKTPTSILDNSPEGAKAAIVRRAAASATKYLTNASPWRTTQDPRGAELLERYSNLGNQVVGLSQVFTTEEMAILKKYMDAGHGILSTKTGTVVADVNENIAGTSTTVGQVEYTATTFNGKSYSNSGSRAAADLAYESGPYFSVPGNPDISLLEDQALGMNTLGGGMQISAGNRIADDIVLADDYDVTELVFYGYQTNASVPPTTINDINVQIWDGDPSDAGSSVIWGDDFTNVFTSAEYSNAIRHSETSPGTARQIQRVIVETPGLSLAAGTYWVDWQMGGDAAFSGPWQPPVVILGQSTTGNSQQSIGGVWGPWLDTGTNTQLGAPVQVYGDCTSCGGGGGPAVAYCIENASLQYSTFDPADGSTTTPISGSPISGFEGGGAIDPNDPTTAYAMDFAGDFYSVDVATGTYTLLGTLGLPGAETGTGLEFDATSGTLYLLTTDCAGNSTLSTIDIGSVTRTSVGNTALGCGIALAIDAAGNGYSYDIINDEAHSIDLTTGAATLLGSIGFDANFGQGMCYDAGTDTVYLSAFNNGLFDSEWRTMDTTTGNTTLINQMDSAALTQYGWVSVTGGGGGGGGTACSEDNPSNSFENGFFTGTGPTAPQQVIATDITVPVATDFTMTTVTANLMVNPGQTVATGDLIFYNDLAGLPDSASIVATNSGVVPTSQIVIGSAFGFDVLEVVFDVPAVLLAGDEFDTTTYWLSIYLDASDGGDSLWEATGATFEGLEAAFSVDNGATWAGYAAGWDMVYVFEGTCEDIGGGGGGNGCNQEHLLSANVGGGVGSSVDSDFKSAADFVVAAGEQFTLETIDATFLTFAPNDPPTTANIVYYEDNGGLPGAAIGSETVVPTIVSSSPWANPVADQYITTMSVTPTIFYGDPLVETTYWIEVSMGTATFQPTVFWEYNRDGVEGNALAQFDGAAGTWSHPDLDGDGNPDLDAEVIYNFAGTCDPLDLPTYDDCEGALPIVCGSVVQGDTIGATDDSAVAPDCDTPTTTPGVWYKFEDNSGLAADITLSTCSAMTDYDTKISVYTGDCNNPPLTCVAGNDDDPNCSNFQSSVEFSSDGNTTFFILVHGFGGQTGNFELSMTCDLIPPPNDDIDDAIDLDEVGCPFVDEDVAMPAATTEGGTPTDCDITGANGVWYVFTPELDGQITGTIATPGGVDGAFLSVNNGPLSGNYTSVAADFGGAIPMDPLTADSAVVIDADTTGDPNDACDPIDNGADLSGKFAIIRRGSCEFGFKALAAQNEGAVAVVVVNNQPGDPIVMGGGAVGGDVTIPVVMVTDVDGEAIITEVLGGGTVNMTLVSGLDGFSSVTFYTAPDENSNEDDLVLVDWWQNQCVPGATATIPVTAGQTYYCFVVNTGSVTDIIFDNCQLDTASNEIEGFVFYPNPANDYLNLSATQNIENVAMYNILGQKVIEMDVEATQTQVSVSNLAAGAYIMQVTVDGQKGTYKVIKN